MRHGFCDAVPMTAITIGIQLVSRCDSWRTLAAAAVAVDELGFDDLTCSMAPPYDPETLTRLVEDVLPLATGTR